MVSYVNWTLWDHIIFNFLLTLTEDDESDDIDDDDKTTDNKDDEA